MIMPVQAMVQMLESSIVPQDTITAGTGASRVAPRHCALLIFKNVLSLCCIFKYNYPVTEKSIHVHKNPKINAPASQRLS